MAKAKARAEAINMISKALAEKVKLTFFVISDFNKPEWQLQNQASVALCPTVTLDRTPVSNWTVWFVEGSVLS